MNHSLDLGDPRMPVKKTWGHQVATRFSDEDLATLDRLVEKSKYHGSTTPTGRWTGPSRSSVIVELVRAAGSRVKSKGPRQVDLEELIAERTARTELAAGVDALERSAKKLEHKTTPKKKPRPAPPKKRRPARQPKRGRGPSTTASRREGSRK